MKQAFKIFTLLIVSGCFYSGYDFYNFYSEDLPKMKVEQDAKARELASVQAELVHFQSFVKNIESVKHELKELNLQLESALESMPRTLNLSGLLRNLTQIADNSGVEVQAFKPRKVEEKEENKFYSTISIDCQMKGSFTRMLVFFDQVSRLKRILNVDAIKMRVPQERLARSSGVNAEIDLTLKAYRFTE